MDNINNSYLKSVKENPIEKSLELILKLYYVVKDCSVCQNNLLKMAGVNQTPAQQTDDNTQPQVSSKELNIINDYIKRHQ